MSWGTFWMFYRCPQCAAPFKSDAQCLDSANAGKCPHCHVDGIFVGESGETAPEHPDIYQETE